MTKLSIMSLFSFSRLDHVSKEWPGKDLQSTLHVRLSLHPGRLTLFISIVSWSNLRPCHIQPFLIWHFVLPQTQYSFLRFSGQHLLGCTQRVMRTMQTSKIKVRTQCLSNNAAKKMDAIINLGISRRNFVVCNPSSSAQFLLFFFICFP